MKNKSIKDYAKLFRIFQTGEKLRKDSIQGADVATNVHYNVGNVVRTAIEKIGGTMPEDLPKPEKSIQEIESADGEVESEGEERDDNS